MEPMGRGLGCSVAAFVGLGFRRFGFRFVLWVWVQGLGA